MGDIEDADRLAIDPIDLGTTLGINLDEDDYDFISNTNNDNPLEYESIRDILSKSGAEGRINALNTAISRINSNHTNSNNPHHQSRTQPNYINTDTMIFGPMSRASSDNNNHNKTPVIIVDDGRNFSIDAKKKRKSGKSKLGKILKFGKKKRNDKDMFTI